MYMRPFYIREVVGNVVNKRGTNSSTNTININSISC